MKKWIRTVVGVAVAVMLVLAYTHRQSALSGFTSFDVAKKKRFRDSVYAKDYKSALDTPERLIARYAPGTSIEFETAAMELGKLEARAGVDRTEVDGERVVLHTETPESVLAQLFNSQAAWTPVVQSMRDLRVRTGTLEDVFIALTGRTLRS